METQHTPILDEIRRFPHSVLFSPFSRIGQAMRRLFIVTLIAVLSELISVAQQDGSSAISKPLQVEPAPLTFYYVGPGVTSPELLPSAPLPVFDGKCKKRTDSVEFVVIVDKMGQPRGITYSRGLITDSDKLALQIVTADHFAPGTRFGEAAAVEVAVSVDLKGCIEAVKDESGHRSEAFHLRSQPSQKLTAVAPPPEGVNPPTAFQTGANSGGSGVYRVGGGISAPVPLNSVEARYTTAARKAKIQGNCWISFIVDANGMPQNAKVVHGLDPGLDQNALDAVSKYRFKPAMKHGQPVPVMITVQVNFKLY